MSDYFKPWCRKIGVLTLGLACVLMIGWIRSRTIGDALHTNAINLASFQDSIVIAYGYKQSFSFPRWESSNNLVDWDTELGSDFKWSWRFCGFGCGGYADRAAVWFVPYWSILIPLVLLSVWLLFSVKLRHN